MQREALLSDDPAQLMAAMRPDEAAKQRMLQRRTELLAQVRRRKIFAWYLSARVCQTSCGQECAKFHGEGKGKGAVPYSAEKNGTSSKSPRQALLAAPRLRWYVR